MRVLVALLAAWAVSNATPASARTARGRARHVAPAVPAPTPGTRVAVQPISGTVGPALRAQLTRLLSARGFRVLTSVAPASGTAQYPGMAREHRLAAFVVTDVTERGHSANVTFLVWNAEGSVIDRWSVWASDKKLWKAVAKGFWQRLGKALSDAQAPPIDELELPGPTLHINAGDPNDEPIVSDGDVRRTAPPILR